MIYDKLFNPITDTDIAEHLRTCKTCGNDLPVDSFYQRNQTKHGRKYKVIDTSCKTCILLDIKNRKNN